MSIGKANASRPRLRGVGANFVGWLALVVRPVRRPCGLWPARASSLAGIGVAVVLVGLSMALFDWRGVLFARALPAWVVEVFNEITDFGKSNWSLIPIGVAIVLAAILATSAAGRVANLVLTSLIVRLEFVFVAIAAPSLFVTIVKRLIGRVRPSDAGPFVYFPFSWRAAYASMPSGHATTAVAAAIAVGAVWPRARIVMWIYALVIMASRVIIEAHYVSDVIAAAFVGGFGAILVRNWFAARGLAFVPGPDGAVHAMPSPSWRRIKSVAARLLGR